METVTGDEGTDKKPEDPPTSSDGVAMEKEVDGEGEGVTRRGEKRGREEEGDGSQPSAKRPKSEPGVFVGSEVVRPCIKHMERQLCG